MILWCLAVASAAPDVEQAQAAFAAKDWPEAIKAYRALAKADAEDARVRFRLAYALEQSGKARQAVPHYQQALEHGFWPTLGELALARVLAATGALDDAEQALDRGLQAGLEDLTALREEPAFAALRERPAWPGILERADQNARPCQFMEQARDFDFWIGSWKVVDEAGTTLGTNTIEPIEEGCALIERWSSGLGGTGLSLNRYDPAREVWIQDWVASNAWQIHYEGNLDPAGRMVMQGHETQKDGSTAHARGTWEKLEDGNVLQILERSEDGETWTLVFRGWYVPADP